MTRKAPDSFRVDAEPEDDGKTLARVLHDRGGVSHSRAKGLIAAGVVRVNGVTALRVDARLRPGDRIDVTAEAGRAYRTTKRDHTTGPGFRILFEDDHVVVVEKEAGLLSVPVPSSRGESLQGYLTARDRLRGRRAPDVRAVHRIDRFTSGLVAFARSSRAFGALRREFASGSPERVYLAVVEGLPPADSGRLEHVLRQDPKSLKVRVAPPGAPGRKSSLRYRVRERFAAAALLEVRLETGRRNQIRVQFAAEGHPLLGDVAYGTPSSRIDRVALHAWRLSFAHPVGGEPLRFEAAPPPDFRNLLRSLRRESTEGRETATRPRGPVRRYR